ncbi:3728_t:CDS:1, partial [Entrophospora sp. SA101]
NLVFREQQLGPTLKRRTVAVHNVNVSRYHSDNGSDIRKMLESQRKPFRDLLEKEFDKRGQRQK